MAFSEPYSFHPVSTALVYWQNGCVSFRQGSAHSCYPVTHLQGSVRTTPVSSSNISCTILSLQQYQTWPQFGLCCQEMVIVVNLFLLLLELPFLWTFILTLALCAPAEIKNWVPCCYQTMQGNFSRVLGIRLLIYFHYKINLQFIHTEHPYIWSNCNWREQASHWYQSCSVLLKCFLLVLGVFVIIWRCWNCDLKCLNNCGFCFSNGRIAAVPLSAAVDGFKAHLVFKEIEKKLQEVSDYFFYLQQDFNW